MELEAERVRLGFLRTTREALEGIEPLLAFYLARERDIMTLATIGAGLEAGMPPEAIRRRAGPVWWEC
jgi:vacuolar-type H+-ATPase subunit C/Vma6